MPVKLHQETNGTEVWSHVDLPDAASIRLNLGCGPVQPAGWINIDGSHRARFAHYLPWVDRTLVLMGLLPPTAYGPRTQIHNLRRRLDYPSNCVTAIYAGELWEHFEYHDAVALTRECYRVLRPAGVLRLCVPDGVVFWRRYLELFEEVMAQPRALRSGARLREHVGLYFNDICTRPPGLRSMGHKHKWQFDEIQLIEIMEQAGFAQVSRMPFHNSRIPDIASVERSPFLIVEGVKPAHKR